MNTMAADNIPWWVIDSGVYGPDWSLTIYAWVALFLFLAGVVFTAFAVARGGEDDPSRWLLLFVFVAITWPAVVVIGSVFGVLNLLWRGLVGAMKP